GPLIVVGETEQGIRRCVPLLGGRFWGDLEGEVVPGGTDWQSVLPSGTLEIAAHYALKTRSGSLLEVSSNGVRSGTPEVLARLARGEPVARDEYYFRTHLRFRAADPELRSWNTRLFSSVGERFPDRVRLQVFELL